MTYLTTMVYAFIMTHMPVQLSNAIVNLVDNLFTNWATGILKSTYNTDSVETATSLVKLSNSVYADLFSIVNSVFGAVKPVGFALVTTFFLIHMFHMATNEQITIESLAKLFIALIVTVGIVGNLDSIINALLQIGDDIIGGISNVSDLNDPGVDELVDKLKDDGILGFTMWLSSIIVWLMHIVATVIIYMGAISRALDVGWRIALAPIAVANAFEGGANSNAMRYLKSLFGAILAGAAMIIIMQAGFTLSRSFFGDSGSSYSGFTRLLLSSAAMLATGMAATGASAKVKEVVG